MDFVFNIEHFILQAVCIILVIASVSRIRPNVLPFENGCKYAVKVEKRALNETGALSKMAEPTGLEPATSDVTGRRSNQLNYDSAKN